MATPKWRRNHRRPWTREHDALLRREWGALSVRGLRTLLGRTAAAIRERARILGLRTKDMRRGYEGLVQAAKRCGFASDTMRALLDRHGVPWRRTFKRQQRPCSAQGSMRVYDPDAVDEAVAAELRLETPNSAAQRHGVKHRTLHRWLVDAGVITSRQRGKPHRIPSDVIDRVVAEHRNKRERKAA